MVLASLLLPRIRHAGPDGPLSDEERSRSMPLEMWAVTGHGWPYGLSHALSCVLLLASLSSNQVKRITCCGIRPALWMVVFCL